MDTSHYYQQQQQQLSQQQFQSRSEDSESNINTSNNNDKSNTVVASVAVQQVQNSIRAKDDLEKDNLNKIFNCDQCDKVFARKHNLETHKLVHSLSKPYTCTICKSGFKRSHDLKRHQRMHTGEKPHLCNKCDRSFARADALLRHTKHGCNSNTPSKLGLFQTFDQQQDDSFEKEDLIVKPTWKPTTFNNRSQSNELTNSPHSSRSTSVTTDIIPNQHNTNYQKPIPVMTTSNPQAKITFLEHRIQQLENHIDNDQFRIKNLEMRLSRLESLNLSK